MAQNKDLDNRLLQLVAGGYVDQARQIIKEGASPDARDTGGRTGLHLALNLGEYEYSSKGRELMAIFLNRGVDVNAGDNQGMTALHVAALSEGYNCRYKVGDLLNFGANLEARDNKGQTPLHHAARHGKKTDAISLFIDAKADVNAKDETGATPLHMAAARGDADVIRLLLNAGADPLAETRDGRHIWDFAVEAGQDYQAQCLKAEASKYQRQQALKRREEERKLEAEKPADPWSLLGPDKVAVTTVERKVGYKLTEIFNFSARTYTQIAENLSTRSEAVALKTFDEFDDKTSLERAHAELERLGGKADRAAIHGQVVEKPRKTLKITQPS